jgi:hypothetical protein
MTAQKVAEKSGWNATTVIQHLKAMQKDGLVHVPQWFNHRVMLWVAGPGPNRRRPRQISKPEAMERWRKKQLVSNGAVRAH